MICNVTADVIPVPTRAPAPRIMGFSGSKALTPGLDSSNINLEFMPLPPMKSLVYSEDGVFETLPLLKSIRRIVPAQP